MSINLLDVFEVAERTTFSPLEVYDIDRPLFAVAVEWRGGRHPGHTKGWAVVWRSYCLSEAGEWDVEPIPSSRTKAWLAEHRFTRDTATGLAHEYCQTTEVNGLHVRDLVARRYRQVEEG